MIIPSPFIPQALTSTLVSKMMMLEDYFSIRISNEGSPCLLSLPLLLHGYVPPLHRIPHLLYTMTTQVRWRILRGEWVEFTMMKYPHFHSQHATHSLCRSTGLRRRHASRESVVLWPIFICLIHTAVYHPRQRIWRRDQEACHPNGKMSCSTQS